MSALDRVRKKYRPVSRGTDEADKSPSVTSVGPSHEEGEKFAPLSAELGLRIHAMAKRWEYTDADLAEVLEAARADPAAWLAAVTMDEQAEQARH